MEEKSLVYVFAERLKEMNQIYGVSGGALGIIMEIQPSYIPAIENHRAKASTKIILSTIKNLGVSIDWMIGISSVPYTEETVAAAEEYLSRKIKRLAQTNMDYEKYIVLKRGNMLSEWRELTLDNRFNLLFLNQFMVSQIILKVEARTYRVKKKKADNRRVAIFKSYSMEVPLLPEEFIYLEKMRTVASNPEKPVWDFRKLTVKKQPAEMESLPPAESYETSLFDI